MGGGRRDAREQVVGGDFYEAEEVGVLAVRQASRRYYYNNEEE